MTLFGDENLRRASAHFQRQSFADFDPGEHHVEGIAGFYAEKRGDFLGLVESGCRNSGAEQFGIMAFPSEIIKHRTLGFSRSKLATSPLPLLQTRRGRSQGRADSGYGA
jgi:hypothetical protein